MLLRRRSRLSLAPMPYLLSPSAIVFDCLTKVVFPSGPFCGQFFLGKKGSFLLFFTVKNLFSKIKSWREKKTRPVREETQ